jgi:tetratricopeptide (TPR) repeat protein
VINVIPMYWHWMDRYLSLPLLMLAYGAGVVLRSLAGADVDRTRRVAVASGVLVAFLAARTWTHQVVYADDVTLWEHATQTQPDSYHAWIKLGEVERDRGRLDAAIAAYERAIALEPTLRLGHTALLVAVARRDQRDHGLSPDRSMELGARYIAVLDDVEGLRTVAGDMVQMGYRDAALLPLARSLDLSPVDDGALLRAAGIQREQGHAWLAEFYESRLRAPLPPPEPAPPPTP